MTSPKTILYFVLALALARGVIYASVVPPWQAPDEPAQFERAKASLTATEWNNSSKNKPDWYDNLLKSMFTFNLWDYLDADRPTYTPDLQLGHIVPLYQEVYEGLYGSRLTYAMIGWPLFLAHEQDIVLQLYLIRLNTVLMNVAILLLAYLLSKTIFPHNDFLALGVLILILFNPQHTHMLSTVNNGNLAELLTTVALYFMVKGIIKGFSWVNILAILIFSIAAMWTKATAYFLPFAIGSIGLFYLWKYRKYWRWLLPIGVVLAVVIYFLAPSRLRILVSWAWEGLISGNFYLNPIVPQDLFRSFWAMPGSTILLLHPLWYWLLAVVGGLALVGIVILLITKWRLLFSMHYRPQIQALIVLAVATIMAIGVLLSWNAISNVITYRQGRSIYPVIAPISLFLMLGWQQFIPRNWRKIGLLSITIAFLLFDSLVLFHYIIPFFYSRY